MPLLEKTCTLQQAHMLTMATIYNTNGIPKQTELYNRKSQPFLNQIIYLAFIFVQLWWNNGERLRSCSPPLYFSTRRPLWAKQTPVSSVWMCLNLLVTSTPLPLFQPDNSCPELASRKAALRRYYSPNSFSFSTAPLLLIILCHWKGNVVSVWAATLMTSLQSIMYILRVEKHCKIWQITNTLCLPLLKVCLHKINH